MKRVSQLVMCVMVMLVMVSPTSAQEASATPEEKAFTLVLQVVDVDGDPVPELRMTNRVMQRGLYLRCTTDEAGECEFRWLDATYRPPLLIQIPGAGFVTVSMTTAYRYQTVTLNEVGLVERVIDRVEPEPGTNVAREIEIERRDREKAEETPTSGSTATVEPTATSEPTVTPTAIPTNEPTAEPVTEIEKGEREGEEVGQGGIPIWAAVLLAVVCLVVGVIAAPFVMAVVKRW